MTGLSQRSRLPKRAFIALGLLAFLFVGSLYARLQAIDGASPYPRSVDESFLAMPALRILQSGDPNPGHFRYPSLPIYLTTLGMAGGVLASRSEGTLESALEIESVGFPAYSHPPVMEVPKALFALLASCTLLLVAAIARRLDGGYAVVVIAPLVLAWSGYYHLEGWRYLNVDIIASFFALAATLAILRGSSEPSLRAMVVLPAVLCGATLASKYPSGLILAPALLSVWLHAERERRVAWSAMLLVGVFVAVFCFSPYLLLDLRAALSDILLEARHYADGHPLHEGEPGLGQVLYYGGLFVAEYGWLAVVFSGVGLVAEWRKSRSDALLLCLYPLLLLLVLSVSSTRFQRNFIPAHGMFAVASALGIVSIWRLATRALSRSLSLPVPLLGVFAGFAVAIPLLLTAPVKVLASYAWKVDSRNRLTEWMGENLEGPAVVYLPGNLMLAAAALPDGFELVQLRGEALESRKVRTGPGCYVLAPEYALRGDERQIANASAANAWARRHIEGPPLAEFGDRPVSRTGRSGFGMHVRLFGCARSAPR